VSIAHAARRGLLVLFASALFSAEFGCSASAPISKSAPDNWHGLRLGMTRREAAEFLQMSGIRWSQIQPPGTAPSAWANHTDVEFTDLAGNDVHARQFGLLFADGQRWNYGGLPRNDEVIKPDVLIGGADAESALIGIQWQVDRSDREKENHTVPWEVLSAFGGPHEEKADITGFGSNYYWKWADVKAHYSSPAGILTISKADVDPSAAPDAGPSDPAMLGFETPAPSSDSPAVESDDSPTRAPSPESPTGETSPLDQD
jgi:hypothetical protein